MKQNTCGLEGSVHVFTHVDAERRTCWGTLTDWNERRCGSEATLRLQLYGRCTVTERMQATNGAATAGDGYVEQGLVYDMLRTDISSAVKSRRKNLTVLAHMLPRPVLFFSRPRSDGWPHHGRTFSIYHCPLSF